MSPIVNLSGRKKVGFAASLAITVVAALNGAAAKAAVVFNDTFDSPAGQTIAHGVVSSNATTYTIASTKNSPEPTIAPGDLHVGLPSTTSGVIEAQALFTNSPVALSNAGDFVQYQISFTNNGAGLSGNNDTLYFGLYNSANSAPLTSFAAGNSPPDLITSGLSSGTTYNSGGVQNWNGYVFQYTPAAATTATGIKTITRPAQGATNPTNAVQDLVANGASGGTFNNPNGQQVGSTAPGIGGGLSNSTVYTAVMNIALNGDGTQTITDSFYAGTDTTAAPISTVADTTSASITTPLPTSFDGLAFGWRHSVGTGSVSSIDVSDITITSNVAGPAAPEPATLGAMALGALALVTRRRKA